MNNCNRKNTIITTETELKESMYIVTPIITGLPEKDTKKYKILFWIMSVIKYYSQ